MWSYSKERRMGDLSQNFSRREFRCKCGCGLDSVDYETLQLLETIRTMFDDRPLRVISGFRCESHNRRVGGARNSQHLYGRAADITISDVSPSDIWEFVSQEYPGRYGVGLYPNFTHVDTRTDGPARWREI